MEINKFDKIEVPLLNTTGSPNDSIRQNSENYTRAVWSLAGSEVLSDDFNFMGIAMNDTSKGDLVTVNLKDNFVVSGC